MEKFIGNVLSPRLPHRLTNRQRKEGFVKKHHITTKRATRLKRNCPSPRDRLRNHGQNINTWQRMEDSNLRMLESKSSALPLGDTPSITSMYSKDAGLILPHNRLHILLPLVHKPREPLLLFHMPKTHKHLNLSSAHDQIDSI